MSSRKDRLPNLTLEGYAYYFLDCMKKRREYVALQNSAKTLEERQQLEKKLVNLALKRRTAMYRILKSADKTARRTAMYIIVYRIRDLRAKGDWVQAIVLEGKLREAMDTAMALIPESSSQHSTRRRSGKTVKPS